ncbi:hypothetical protein GWI33_013835 [Rhynchophorus ferrugineus]|uniref:Uncharacterized protein n=1 Tax=Rhynchophorus ferrugineus TaxID=354439 RepID=A0A834I6A3_RHYFE|nr:hypothetical protein GWI33_013835 [Rhynchophorus ferrugineus]
MGKLCSKWVPGLHAVNKIQEHVDDYGLWFAIYKSNKPDILYRYVTVNETWIHRFSPESKRSSTEWTASDETRLMRPKAQQTPGELEAGKIKTMAKIH